MAGDDAKDAYFGLSSKAALILGVIILVSLGGYVLLTTSGNDLSSLEWIDWATVGLIAAISIGSLLIVATFFTLIFLGILASLRHRHREKRAISSTLLRISVPKENELLADAAEAMFAGLYSVYDGPSFPGKMAPHFVGQNQFSFEIVSQGGRISFYAHVPKADAELLERQIYSQYPDADIVEVDDYNIFSPGCHAEFCELTLAKESAYPIHNYRDLAKEVGTQQLRDISVDSMSGLSNAIGKLEEEESAAIQIIVRPSGKKWQEEGKVIIDSMYEKSKGSTEKPGDQLTPGQQEQIRAIERTIGKAGFETIVRIVTTSQVETRAELNQRHLLAAFEQFNTVDNNRFSKKGKLSKPHFFRAFMMRYFPLVHYKSTGWLFFLNPWLTKYCGIPMVLNSEALASLYHLPNKNINTPQIDWLKAKRAPAPQEVPSPILAKDQVSENQEDVIMEDRILLGYNNYRGVRKDVCIKTEDRRRHIYSIGRTGMGKSVFMENQIYQDIVNGEGVCVVDPHGDLARKCLEFVPKSRMHDVIYFDPSDIDRPMGLNMLEANTPEEKDFAVQELVAILYKLFAEFIGPRFEHIVRNSMLAIMEHPDGGTLVEMMRILTDDKYRDECVKYVKNPLVRAFWEEEMAQQVQFHKSEMLGPVLSKFGRFVSNDMMRNIIGQTKSAFNFRDVMDNQKILLINLAKGKVGDINCNLLGMIIVGKLLMAALSRTDMAEADRKDFYLYVDEFQNFATDSFATILSEARKYRLSLNVTHQYVGQLKEEIQKAVFGNVGTFITFRIGAPDAELIGKEVKPIFDETDLLNLQKYTGYVKLLVDGVSTKAFSMHTMPPVTPPFNDISKQLTELSRHKYGSDRATVDADIRRRGRLDVLLQNVG